MPSDDVAVPAQDSPQPATGLRHDGHILMMAVAGCACAWLASLCAYLYDLNVRPEVLRDGQYAFRFIETIPIGWIIGVLGVALRAIVSKLQPRRLVATTALGLVIATPLVTLLLLALVPVSLGLLIQLFQGR